MKRILAVFAHPDDVRFLLERQARSPSMPSAHAANSFAVAVVCVLLWFAVQPAKVAERKDAIR